MEQEILINYDVFVEEPVIPVKWILAAVKLYEMGLPGLLDCSENAVGYDIATTGSDRNIYQFREGRVFYKPVELTSVRSGTEGAEKVLVRARRQKAKVIHYDENAYGSDISYTMVEKQRILDERGNVIDHEFEKEQKKNIDRHGIRWHGVKGNRSAPHIIVNGKDFADNIYQNYRAFSWFRTRERFRITYDYVEGINKNVPLTSLIAMPNHEELIAELSTPRIIRDGKKYAVEKKVQLKKRNSNRSVDYADAFILCDDEESYDELLINSFDVSNPDLVQNFEIDFAAAADPFGAINMDEIGNLYFMIGLYYYNSKKFKIIWCDTFTRDTISDIVKKISAYLKFLTISDWYASDEIMKSITDGLGSLWMEFSDNDMFLVENFNKDKKRAITDVNKLFREKRLIIHQKNKKLLENISGLTLDESGKFPDNPYAKLLILIISSINHLLFGENQYAGNR